MIPFVQLGEQVFVAVKLNVGKSESASLMPAWWQCVFTPVHVLACQSVEKKMLKATVKHNDYNPQG